jgi:hypothetical protein
VIAGASAIRMATEDKPTRTRLHISPLNPTILPAVVPPSIQPNITNLTYHKVPTFPENGYGYLELPAADAERIKKRLNGLFVQGKKMKIDEARPDKKRKRREAELVEGRGVPEEEAVVKRPKKEKRKKEQGVFPGITLPEGRDVKRGWTQPAEGEKKKHRSKKEKTNDHTGQEMLFKTHLPANVASKTSSKDKKEKRAKEGRGKPGRGAEVKEFAKTSKYPTFLRTGGGDKGAVKPLTFEDGKGWVDEEGNVVEPVVATRSTRPRPDPQRAKAKEEVLIVAKEDDESGVEGDGDRMDTDKPAGAIVDVNEEDIFGEEDDAADLVDVESEDEDVYQESQNDLIEKEAHEEVAIESDADEDIAVDGEVDSAEQDGTVIRRSLSVDVEVDDDGGDSSTMVDFSDGDRKANTAADVTAADQIEKSASDAESSEEDEEDSASEPDESSDDENEVEEEEHGAASAITATNETILPSAEPPTPGPAAGLLASSMGPPASVLTKDVHPLEALYKRAKPSATIEPDRTPNRPAPIQTAFSFFGGQDIDADDDASSMDQGMQSLAPPQTPFTQRDLEHRGMRSAAPTPDTAAINKRFAWNVPDDDEHDDDDDEAESTTDSQQEMSRSETPASEVQGAPSGGGKSEQSEFEKHFYAMRGEYNRSWKQRKREARKEVRQSENRRTGFGK